MVPPSPCWNSQVGWAAVAWVRAQGAWPGVSAHPPEAQRRAGPVLVLSPALWGSEALGEHPSPPRTYSRSLLPTCGDVWGMSTCARQLGNPAQWERTWLLQYGTRTKVPGYQVLALCVLVWVPRGGLQ